MPAPTSGPIVVLLVHAVGVTVLVDGDSPPAPGLLRRAIVDAHDVSLEPGESGNDVIQLQYHAGAFTDARLTASYDAAPGISSAAFYSKMQVFAPGGTTSHYFN